MINAKTGFRKPRVRKKWPNMATLCHSRARFELRLAAGAFGIASSHPVQHCDFVGYVNYFLVAKYHGDTGPDTYRSIDRPTGHVPKIDRRPKKS